MSELRPHRRFSPKTEQWMIYDMPTMNIEAHAMGMAPGLVDGRVRMVCPFLDQQQDHHDGRSNARGHRGIEGRSAEGGRAVGARGR